MNTILIFCLVACTQGLDDEDFPTITTLPYAPEFRITEKTKVEMIIKPLRQDDVERASDLTLHLPNGTLVGEQENPHNPGDAYMILTSLKACKKQENLYITYNHFKSTSDSSEITWRVNNISYIPNVHTKGCTEPPVDTWYSRASPGLFPGILIGGGGVLLISLLVLIICCCYKKCKKGEVKRVQKVQKVQKVHKVQKARKRVVQIFGFNTKSKREVEDNSLYGAYYMGDEKMRETEVGLVLSI